MQQFQRYIQARITELESMPYHGQEFAESSYIGSDEVERVPVFDESEFLDYCADIVREIYVQAVAFGYVQEPPTALMSRDAALFYMRQVAAWVEKHGNREADFLTLEKAAERLQVSKDSVYDLISQGLLEHTKVGRLIRKKPSALEHIQVDEGW